MKLCLTVLMGLPGSGKTTFARSLMSYYQETYNFIHVCYDELIPNDYQQLLNDDKKWKELRTAILNEIDIFLFCCCNNNFSNCPQYFRDKIDLIKPVTVLVIDDNMYLRSMRYALYKEARKHGISYCQVYFRCTVECAIEHNLSRTMRDVVPNCVITLMNEKIEEPKHCNKWERHSLAIDGFSEMNKLYEEYLKLLTISLQNPEDMESTNVTLKKDMSMLICLTNALHQSDICLRQIISEKIKSFLTENITQQSKLSIKDYTALLAERKKKILDGIKLGSIQLPNDILPVIEKNQISDRKCLKLFLEKMFDAKPL